MKYCIFFICGLFTFSIQLKGQDQMIVDSMSLVLDTAESHNRFLALYELTFQYAQKDNEVALQFIKDAEEAAFEAGDSLWMVKSKRVKGQLLYFLEKMREAEDELYSALPMALRNDYNLEQLRIEQTLSKVNLFKGSYDDALKFSFKALELSKRLSDTLETSLALNSIAVTYYKLKDYHKALDYYKEAFELAHVFTPLKSFFILANIGLCYANLGDFYRAQDFVQRSLRDCGANCPDKSRINIEYAFGVIAFGERKFNIAEKHFLVSFDLAKKYLDTRFQFDNIYMLADLKMRQRRFNEAEVFLLQAEKLIGAGTPFKLEMIKIFSAFSKLYMETRAFRKAAYYQEKYISLKDNVYNEDLTTSLMRVEAEHMERKNRTRIAAQEENIKLKEQDISSQTILNRITLLLILIFVICLILLFRNYRQKIYLNALLEKKIGERTRELQLNRDQLLKAFQEHDLLLKRTYRGVIVTSKTIRGLCCTGKKEISDPIALTYIEQIGATSGRLDELLASFGREMSNRH